LILSPLQVAIFTDRFLFPGRFTYQALREKDGISSDKTLITCLTRTAYGFLWMPWHEGGRRSYLSDLDIANFRKANTCEKSVIKVEHQIQAPHHFFTNLTQANT
jgi:hypothetical protein